jgi:hypothetical protein
MTYQQELPWEAGGPGRPRAPRRAPGGTRRRVGTLRAAAGPDRAHATGSARVRSLAAGTRATRPSGVGRAPAGHEDWRLDEPTRRAGRRGLAEARAALARVRAASSGDAA